MTLNGSPSPWRSAMASARPAKPPPPISTSVALGSRFLGIALSSPWRKYITAPQSRCLACPPSLHRPAHHPRPRTARGEPVPRPQPADRLAARVRRPGDRPGAGRGQPHGRGRACRIRCTPISCWPATRRCRSSTRSTASATARASPPGASSRSSTASAIFSMSVSFHDDEPGLDHQMPMPDVPQPDAAAERGRDQAEHPAAAAGAGAPLLRARAADRAAAGGFRPLSPASGPKATASTSGSAPPRRCPTIRRSTAACSPMPPT